MSYDAWNVPINAESYRSTDLAKIEFSRNALFFTLIEEETEERWCLSFDSVQAFRSTTEECSATILNQLPVGGGFFKSNESDWLTSLGKGDIPFLNNACHFIICCYDEVIEVIADENTPQFNKIIS